MIERCVGRTFPVMDLNNQGMLQIDIGELTGRAACMESIWIEPDCVEPVPR